MPMRKKQKKHKCIGHLVIFAVLLLIGMAVGAEAISWDQGLPVADGIAPGMEGGGSTSSPQENLPDGADAAGKSETTDDSEMTDVSGISDGTSAAEEPETSDGADAAAEPETGGGQDAVDVPVVQTIKISAVGDVALGPVQTRGYSSSIHAYYDKYGAEYFFEGVSDILTQDDLTLVNLECVLSDETERVEKTWNIKGKPQYTDILLAGSVEFCALGNNHSRDYGNQSLADTKQALEEADIMYGIRDTIARYTGDDGLTVGIISVKLLSSHSKYEKYVENGIKTLQEEGTDLIIACVHWGVEKSYEPTDFQQSFGHQMIDWGADLVLGSHPHVLQGIEFYNGKLICYSLGNFVFGANVNPEDKDTMIFQQTFTFVDGQLQDTLEAEIIPCRLSSVNNKNDYQPTVLEGREKQSIIDKINARSLKYSALSVNEDGRLVAELE